MQADNRLSQLLCSRLCHDLAGAAGAVNTGMELIAEAEGPVSSLDTQTMDFVIDSARQVTDRLSFYRLAFGFGGGTDAQLTRGDARRLAENFVDRARFDVRWDCPDTDLTVGQVNVLFTMILIALGCLPRGGALACGYGAIEGGFGIAMTASGNGARLGDDDDMALDMTVPIERLSARNIHVRWGMLLADAMGGRIEISAPRQGEAPSRQSAEVRLAVLLAGR